MNTFSFFILSLMFVNENVQFLQLPEIVVESREVKSNEYGKFIEMKEGQTLFMKCSGPFDFLKFILPNLEDNRGHKEEDFISRVELIFPLSHNGSFGYLIIMNVTESDTGAYSCSQENDTSLNDTLYVFVRGTSVFVPLRSVEYSYKLGEIQVPCKATSFLDKQNIELYVNGELVKDAWKNYKHAEGFKLTNISLAMKPTSRTPFECRYTGNPSESVTYWITGHEEEHKKIHEDQLIWNETINWPNVGHNYSLTCSSNHSAAVLYNVHLLRFTCLLGEQKNRSNLSTDSFFITIQLASLTSDDPGYYTCVWSDDRMNKTRNINKHIRIGDKRPARLIAPDKPKETYEDKNIIFRCTFPQSTWTVNWMYDGDILPTTTDIDQYFKVFRDLLEDMYPSYDRNYICLVTMRNREKHPIEVNQGKSATLECQFIGEPAMTVKWFKDGNTYENEKLVFNTTSIISKVQVEDEGEYSCRAMNLAGIRGKKITVKFNKLADAQFDYLKLLLILIIVIAVSGLVFVCVIYLFQLQKSETRSEMYKHLIQIYSKSPTEESSDLSPNQLIDAFSYNEKYELNSENIETGEVLGRGNFGIVYEGWIKKRSISNEAQTSSRLAVAIKAPLDGSDENQIKMLAEEFRVMCSIGKHPNVLALIGAVTKNLRHGEIFVVMEMCELGNLRDYLRENREKFVDEFRMAQKIGGKTYLQQFSGQATRYPSETDPNQQFLQERNNFAISTSDLYLFSMQISSGMEYLAQVPCVHRDLAARNVLLTSNKTVKIADFGMARKHEDKTYYRIKNKDLELPYKWMSPETIQEYKYTQKSDVWAFGITLYEIFSLGKTPYPFTHCCDLLDFLLAGNRNSKPKYCDEDVYELMKNCWEADPLDRPNFAHCVYFFREHIKEMSPQLLERLEYDTIREAAKQETLDSWLDEGDPDPRILVENSQPSSPSKSEHYYVLDFSRNL